MASPKRRKPLPIAVLYYSMPSTFREDTGSIQILNEIPAARRFIDEAYKHGKPIAASSAGVELVNQTKTGELVAGADAAEQGVLLGNHADHLASEFIEAIAQHRFHNRPVDKIMA